MKMYYSSLTIATFLILQGCGGSTSASPSTTAAAFQVNAADVGTYKSSNGRNGNGTTLVINADSSMTYTTTVNESGSTCSVTETGIITGETTSGSYETFQYQINSAQLASSNQRGNGGNGRNNGRNGNSSTCTTYVNQLNASAAAGTPQTGTISEQGLTKEQTY